jgi:hypothetical protein
VAVTHRLLAGNWNEPYLLVGCLGNVLKRVGIKAGSDLRNAACFRDAKYLHKYSETFSNDMITQTAKRFAAWAKDGFDKPFGLDVAEAEALYVTTNMKVFKDGTVTTMDPAMRENVDAMIKRWVTVDIMDPGMPIVSEHFDQPGRQVRPRSHLPRDVRRAVDAYLLAYEPGHARAYVNSWKRAQEGATP